METALELLQLRFAAWYIPFTKASGSLSGGVQYLLLFPEPGAPLPLLESVLAAHADYGDTVV